MDMNAVVTRTWEKPLYLQHWFEGPLASIRLGLLHADGLVHGLQLGSEDIDFRHLHLGLSNHCWSTLLSKATSNKYICQRKEKIEQVKLLIERSAKH